MKSASVLFLVILIAGCGGGDDDGGDPGAPDGGGDDDPIPEPGEPILDRDSPGTHACEVLDEPVEVAGAALGSAIAQVGEGQLVARTSYGPLGGDQYGFILGVTPVELEPMSLGDEAYRATAPDTLRAPAMASAGDGAILAWSAGDTDASIRVARLDAAGDLVGAPVTIAGADGNVVTVAATATLVAWVDAALHVQTIDEDGAPAGDATLVRTAIISGVALAPAGEGSALVWSQLEEDAGVYLALLDAAGAVTAGPLRVSGAVPELSYVQHPAVIAAGDELLVAWSEQFWNEDQDGNLSTFDPAGHSVIRVARVAGDADRVLAFERLQAVEEDVIHIHPAFVPQGDAVALSWSRGTFIPVCGGCISDNTRHLVVLEPHDLVPLSEPIEMDGASGFSSATMIAAGDDLTHLLGLDYHAISTVALARTRCASN